MKTISTSEIPAIKNMSSIRSPIKICMHLMASARNDARVMRDATALRTAGYFVTIVDIEGDRTRPQHEVIDGIHLKHIIMPSFFVPTHFKPLFLVKLALAVLYSTIQLLKIQADVYHAHVEKALPACYIVAGLRKKPLIFDVPDLTLSDPGIMRWRRLRSLSIHFLAYMVSRCTSIITASPRYIPELRALYHASNVTIVRNVPTYQSVSPSNLLRHHLHLDPKVHIALYQGNIQPNRGLDRLVRAAKFLAPNIVIVLMGQAVEPTRSQLEALINSEQVADRVKLLPPVPYVQLLDWTTSADIGLTIFPPEYSLSIRFTLPNKLFEYLMAGLPVLSAQLDAVVDVIHTYDVGQVADSLAPAELGKAINTMFADKALMIKMRQNAFQAAKNEFHWEKESLKLVQLYRAILKEAYDV